MEKHYLNIALISCSFCFGVSLVSNAKADTQLPSCVDSIITPEPGKILSGAALDVNMSCLQSLRTLSEVAKLKAEIAETDRRSHNTNQITQPGGSRQNEIFQPVALPNDPLQSDTSNQQKTIISYPKVEMITGNGKSRTAILSTGQEVKIGSVIHGARITALTNDNVTLKDEDGHTHHLNLDITQ